ncbi:MAG: [FeFe] hydrogenase, group A [Oscillospiraceae bacterium]|nr:[FeFe] hydrogenase, group A [Oscillospiraceae bacterium]
MVTLHINDKEVQVAEGTTVLEACRAVGLNIPTLCYLKGINEIAACRVCVVELKGENHLITACNTVVYDGMEIYTNTPKVQEARRVNVELLMSQHRTNCPTCGSNGVCQLQKVASSLNINETINYPHFFRKSLMEDFPIQRDDSKCIRCYRCVSVCEKVQTLGIWDMVGTGARTTVGVSEGRTISASDCVACGQCVTHCPVNALRVRDDTKLLSGLRGALNNPKKVVVVQTAPAVRAAWGEAFGLSPEVANEKRMAAALRAIGFDYVFDTNFTADLTIMEEGTEFLNRMQHPEDHKWPMFTSCCPGWVRFLKSQYPDMVSQLSTAKSPQQMFGAVTKSYFAQKIGVDPKDIVCVSVMPCSAKKAETEIPNINDAAEGCKDVDIALTTREMCRMIKAALIDVEALPEEEFDSPLGTGTGAAVIFGTTGGVMEAALRTCYKVLTGENPSADETFKAVRALASDKPWVEATYNVNGIEVKTAVVNSLGNARKLIRAVRSGEAFYHFVEVMACPGGCVGGGGQPIHYNEERAADRGKVLYRYDANNTMRFSHENPEVQALYTEYLGEPCGHMSHKLLHTDHTGWQMPPAKKYDSDVKH